MNSALIRNLTVAFWIAGIVVVATLVHLADTDAVMRSVGVIGWGFGLVLMIRVVLLTVDSHSWRCLLPRDERLRLREAAVQRWVGESVSTMLPFAAIGGELARVRISMLAGLSGSLAFASIIMDSVVALLSQFLFLCLGVGLFIQTRVGDDAGRVDQSVAVGTAALLASAAALWLVLRGGALGRLANYLKSDLASERVLWLADAMGSVDRFIAMIADDKGALARAVGWRLLGWLVGATEIWLILHLLGHSISVEHALVLDALTSAVRTAFFFIPGALVVQEGAMMAVGAVLGANGEAILIAAVVKRAREIFFSVPGLFMWHFLEAKKLNQGSAEG